MIETSTHYTYVYESATCRVPPQWNEAVQAYEEAERILQGNHRHQWVWMSRTTAAQIAPPDAICWICGRQKGWE